jgi:hypothetical protein
MEIMFSKKKNFMLILGKVNRRDLERGFYHSPYKDKGVVFLKLYAG